MNLAFIADNTHLGTQERTTLGADNTKGKNACLLSRLYQETLAAYEHWLTRQPLSNHTRRTYLVQVRRYCTYLSTLPWEYGHPLQEPHARDYAVRDYKTALKVVHHAKPSSVNLGLAAVDYFYRFLSRLLLKSHAKIYRSRLLALWNRQSKSGFCGQWSAGYQCGIARLRCCCSTRVYASVNVQRSPRTMCGFLRAKGWSLRVRARARAIERSP